MLGLDVDALVVVPLLGDQRKVEPVRVGVGEACVAIGRPLHRRPDTIAIAEVHVVAHSDLVAVVEDRCAREREQQSVQQLDLAAIVTEQRSETATDAEVDPHLRVAGVCTKHQLTFLVGDHLERQLVMVAEEGRPLTPVGRFGRLFEDVGDRHPVLHLHRHEHPRHQRKVEVHVALVAVTEVGDRVLGPLVRLGEEHPVAVVGVHMSAHALQERVRLGQILAIRAITLVQVWDRVEAEPVDAQLEPVVEQLQHGLLDGRVVEVQVGLVGVEAVPVVLLGNRIPRPVRRLEILEDDPSVAPS